MDPVPTIAIQTTALPSLPPATAHLPPPFPFHLTPFYQKPRPRPASQLLIIPNMPLPRPLSRENPTSIPHSPRPLPRLPPGPNVPPINSLPIFTRIIRRLNNHPAHIHRPLPAPITDSAQPSIPKPTLHTRSNRLREAKPPLLNPHPKQPAPKSGGAKEVSINPLPAPLPSAAQLPLKPRSNSIANDELDFDFGEYFYARSLNEPPGLRQRGAVLIAAMRW